MRIVYVLTSLGIGGAERQALAIAVRMKQRGHTVKVLVLRPRLQEECSTDLDVVTLDMHKDGASLVVGLVRAWRFLREFRPDLLHSHSFHANLFARMLRLFGLRTVLVCTIHNVYEGDRSRMLAYRLTDPLCCLTTAVSAAVAERFVRHKAVAQNKCSVILNGINDAEFVPSTSRRAQTREVMGVSSEFIWLAASRIAPAKDIPNLLRAFALMRVQMPETQLWIAGERKHGLGKDAGGIDEQLASSDGVRWLGVRRDLPALLDATDGFVLASAWEGMPLVVGEAMAMMKPVVATDVGGVRELVGACGTLVPARKPEALAAGMLDEMRLDKDDRESMGKAARARILAQFSMDVRAEEWQQVYDRLVYAGKLVKAVGL